MRICHDGEFAMMEKARHGTKRIVVEMEFVKEEYNEHSETGAFSELRMILALPRQGKPIYAEVREEGNTLSIEREAAQVFQGHSIRKI